MKNIFKVVFVIIGTLIGAGFASGQEIYTFFFSYGIEGLIGIFISSLILGLVIYKTLRIVQEYKIKTYKEFLEVFIKPNSKNNFFNLKDIINIIINIFILITFFIMIAGFGAYFEQEIEINNLVGSTILAFLSYIIFTTSVKGVVKVNGILVPILIIFITIIGLINLKNIDLFNIQNFIIKTNESNSILSGILYASYNSILLIPVLITLKEYLKNKKDIKIISILTTFITLILAIILFLLLINVDVDIKELEMPVVYVVSNMFRGLKIIYGFIILGSIFTTSVSLGTSFLQNTSKNKKVIHKLRLLCV